MVLNSLPKSALAPLLIVWLGANRTTIIIAVSYTHLDVYKRQLVEFAKGYGAKGLAYVAIQEDGSRKSSFAKFMTDEQMDALVQAMNGQPGDLLLFAADRNKIVWNVLGALRLELAEQMGLLDKNEYRFVWITEFPLLEWSDEENRFMAMHHPFTMPMEEDWDCLLYTSRCV